MKTKLYQHKNALHEMQDAIKPFCGIKDSIGFHIAYNAIYDTLQAYDFIGLTNEDVIECLK